MPHLILETFLWVLLVFFVGCILGYLIRKMTAKDAGVIRPLQEATDSDAEVDIESPRVTHAATVPPESAVLKAERPTGIAAPREGKADNLQRISGIGPKNERTLHSLGFFHFDQIAGWTDEEVTWVDNHLKFNGRIVREEWIMQAGLLADGKHEEFERLYGARHGRSASGARDTAVK